MRAKTHFQSTRLGNVKPGDWVADDDYGQHLKKLGLVEDEHKTKVVEQKPAKPREPKTYETKVVEQKPVTRKTRKRKPKRVDNKADD